MNFTVMRITQHSAISRAGEILGFKLADKRYPVIIGFFGTGRMSARLYPAFRSDMISYILHMLANALKTNARH